MAKDPAISALARFDIESIQGCRNMGNGHKRSLASKGTNREGGLPTELSL